jgi:hypothetical protein
MIERLYKRLAGDRWRADTDRDALSQLGSIGSRRDLEGMAELTEVDVEAVVRRARAGDRDALGGGSGGPG